MSRTLVASLLVLLTGCSFDAALPATAAISCSAAQPACPRGTACQVSLGRCLPVDREDREAPSLRSASVSRTELGRGATASVDLVASEALGLPPTVTLVQGARAWPLTLKDADAAAPHWTYELAAPDDGAEERAVVLVDLLDPAGNEARGLVAGTVTLDFTPPSVRSLRYVAPRDADGGAPAVRPAEAMTARVTFSESVDDAVQLTQRGEGCAEPDVAWARVANREGLVDFERPGLPDAGACAWSLWVAAARDRAGNLMATQRLAPGFVVDGTPPLISDLATFRAVDGGLVPADAFSRAPGFDAVELRLTLEPGTTALAVALDDEALPDCALSACLPADAGLACACRRAVTAGDPEGPHVLTVLAQDSAGNQAQASRALRFDFTAPAEVPGAASLTLAPPPGCPLPAVTALGPGGQARVTFTVDEPLGAPPVVTGQGGEVLPFELASGAVTTFTAVHTLGALATDGTRTVTATVVDAVGNARTLTFDGGLAVAVDTQAPGDVAVEAPGQVGFLRAPWGDATGAPRFEVQGDAGAAEPLATVRVMERPVTDVRWELGRATASTTGAFLVPLANRDRTVVSVLAVDGACNQGPVRPVRDVTWLATLGGKVPGTAFPNPHQSEAWGDFEGEVRRPDGLEPDAGLDALDGVGIDIAAQSSWSPRLGPTPTARTYFTLAHDAARERLVLFGGWASTTNPFLADTWEFDGRSWGRRLVQGPTPPGRNAHAITWDARRRRVVLMGGLTATGRIDDTWEWDGLNWRDATPATARLPRLDSHASAWDGVRERVLVFGGTSGISGGPSSVSGATWAWDGEAWRDVSPAAGAPTARFNHGMVWDEARRQVVLFGGWVSSAASAETWTWDGTNWTQRTPATSPPAREAPMMTYDPLRQRVVLVGGLAGGVRLGDVWEWDGVTWAQRTSPAPVPVARYGGDVGFSEARGAVVLFGGQASTGVLNDTWSWDGTAWTNLATAQPRPAARYGVAAAWDEGRQRAVFFGGSLATNVYQGDTWEWNGTTFLNRTVPDAGPPPRTVTSMAYDPVARRTVLFGGNSQQGTPHPLGDTWEWDGTTWVDVSTPDAGPGPRYGHTLAWEPVGQQVLVSGGYNGTKMVNETWTRADGGWGAAVSHPAWLAGFASRLDSVPGAGGVLHFGGATIASVTNTLGEWLSGTWQERGVAGSLPPARQWHGMAWDEAQQRMVVHGGTDSTPAVFDDTWEWDGTRWWPRAPARYAHPQVVQFAMVRDPVRREVLAFGGFNPTTGASSDLWRYGLSPLGRPAHAARFDLAQAAREPGAVLTAVRVTAWAGGDGQVLGAPQTGVALWLPLGGTLWDEARHLATPATPAPVEWRTTDAARMTALFEGPRERVTVVSAPRGANGSLLHGARLRVDYVEVAVSYRRP